MACRFGDRERRFVRAGGLRRAPQHVGPGQILKSDPIFGARLLGAPSERLVRGSIRESAAVKDAALIACLFSALFRFWDALAALQASNESTTHCTVSGCYFVSKLLKVHGQASNLGTTIGVNIGKDRISSVPTESFDEYRRRNPVGEAQLITPCLPCISITFGGKVRVLSGTPVLQVGRVNDKYSSTINGHFSDLLSTLGRMSRCNSKG